MLSCLNIRKIGNVSRCGNGRTRNFFTCALPDINRPNYDDMSPSEQSAVMTQRFQIKI